MRPSVLKHIGLEHNGLEHNNLEHNSLKHNGLKHYDLKHNSSQLSDMKHNGFLRRPTGIKHDSVPRRLFHEFNAVLRDTIVEVAMRDLLECREQNNKDLEEQAQARRGTEEMAREKNMEKIPDG